MRKTIRVISIFLAIAMIVVLPIGEMSRVLVASAKDGWASKWENNPNTKGIYKRLQVIEDVFPNHSFFTADGKACTHDPRSESCNNCQLENINTKKQEQAGLPSGKEANEGHGMATCLAFANYVTYCLYGENFVDHTKDFTIVKNLNEAVVGDYISWSGHQTIFLGYDGSKLHLFDCNTFYLGHGDKTSVVHVNLDHHVPEGYTIYHFKEQ